MTNKTNYWTVGLVHELCPICCTKLNEQILLPQVLSEKVAKEIDKMHGKAIGFSKEPCEDCQEKINKGYLALIGFDETKTETSNDKVNFKDLYRIGLLWIKREVAEKAFTSWVEEKRPESFILLDTEIFNFFAEKAVKPEPENNEKSQSTET